VPDIAWRRESIAFLYPTLPRSAARLAACAMSAAI
jgi:hypothetical protein